MKETINILGMSCAACEQAIYKGINKLEGINKCEINLLKGTMFIDYNENIINHQNIVNTIVNLGYKVNEKDVKLQLKDHKLRDLIISFIFLFLLMYVAMGNMMWNFPLPNVFDHLKNPMGFALLQFLLTLPIIYINRNYFISGSKKLIKKSPNMDTLIALGALASFIYGIVALFLISLGNLDYVHNLYIESGAMILTLVSFGKYLENLSKKKTTSSISKLIDMKPKKALVIRDNNEVSVNANEVKVDEIVILKKGDIVPIDGKIIEGVVSVDESNITGESLPKELYVGNDIFASTTINSGYAKIKTTKESKDTKFENIIKLVEEASSSKAPISKLADKISGVFVPLIISISILTFIINFIVHKDFELSFRFMITVLVIACPCALGLATPVAIMVSTGLSAKNGILIKNAEILERAHNIKTCVLDKTGTITNGKPYVIDYIEYEENLLDKIYSIEIRSEHPLSKAIINYALNKNANLININNYEAIIGKGLKAEIEKSIYFIGNISSLNNIDIETKNKIDQFSKEGKTPLIISKNDKVIGIITIRDEPKSSSVEAISYLKNKGIKTIMLTGDNNLTALAIAKEVNVDEVISDVYPEDKQKIIKNLKKDKKHLVAMVGDGVNDAIALKEADIGIAIGSGSDIAIDSSDIVLLNDSLIDVYNAINLSKRTLFTIKLNLFFAFFYNLICVLIATGAFINIGLTINPMIGSIAMSLSSVSVVLSSLTINLFKPVKVIKECPLKEEIKMEELIINVEGMMCKMCKAHVEKACNSVNGVLFSEASVENKNVIVKGNNLNKEEIVNAIKKEGYKAK